MLCMHVCRNVFTDVRMYVCLFVCSLSPSGFRSESTDLVNPESPPYNKDPTM